LLAAVAFFKLQIPTSKLQRSANNQSPKLREVHPPAWLLTVDYSLGIGAWDLELMKSFWLVKQEPSAYSWSDFVADRGTGWTGVRNYAARNNLRRMREGDEVLFYHSGEEKAVIGIARVKQTAYADPTAKEGDWSAVDLVPIKSLPRPVTLQQIRIQPRLNKIQLVRQSRLSVMPLTSKEFQTIVKIAHTGRRSG
jgi:predicted RNA-binding protein with PUA-like domain